MYHNLKELLMRRSRTTFETYWQDLRPLLRIFLGGFFYAQRFLL